MSSTTTEGTGQRSTQLRRGPILALLAFAQLIVSIDYNIVYVALPPIGEGLGFSDQTLQWVVSAYAVAFGGFLLFGGRASDLFGRRRMFVFGLFLYGLASLIGGLATEAGMLIGARALQGLGGAFLFPATLSLVNTIFEGKDRFRALGVWAAAGASGMVLGSLLGGVLTEAFGWEAVFFVNVPLAAVAILAAFPLISADAERVRGRRFDLPGALTGTIGTTLLVLTLVQGPDSGWTSPEILVSAVLAVLLLVAFVVIESRSQDPLVPLRLFRHRPVSVGVAVTFLFMATFGTLLYFLTVYFQGVHGYSAFGTGMAFLIPMALGFVGSITGGQLAGRIGVRTSLIVSLLVGAVGTFFTALAMSTDGSYWALLPGLAVLSVCQGVIFTTMFAAATAGVAGHEQGVASGIASTGQQVGSAVGLALLVLVANAWTDRLGDEPEQVALNGGLRAAVFVAVAGMVVTALVAMGLPKAQHQDQPVDAG